MISNVTLPQNQLSFRPFLEAKGKELGKDYDGMLDELVERVQQDPEMDKQGQRVADLGRSIRVDPKDQAAIVAAFERRGIHTVSLQQNAISAVAAGIFHEALDKHDLSLLSIAPADTSGAQIVEPKEMGLREDLAYQACKDGKYNVAELLADTAEEARQIPAIDNKQRAELEQMTAAAGIVRLNGDDVAFMADGLKQHGLSDELQQLTVTAFVLQAFQDQVDRA